MYNNVGKINGNYLGIGFCVSVFFINSIKVHSCFVKHNLTKHIIS